MIKLQGFGNKEQLLVSYINEHFKSRHDVPSLSDEARTVLRIAISNLRKYRNMNILNKQCAEWGTWVSNTKSPWLISGEKLLACSTVDLMPAVMLIEVRTPTKEAHGQDNVGWKVSYNGDLSSYFSLERATHGYMLMVERQARESGIL